MKEGKLRSRKGISLVAVAVTVIVMLILGGITFMISKELIIDKAVTASTKTTEAMLQERIEMGWMDTKMCFIKEKRNFNEIVEREDFRTRLTERLEETYNLENVVVRKEEGEINITFTYENREFSFIVSLNGEVRFNNPLKGRVKIGDYVEYPIEYEDVWSKEKFTEENGWRVIDDGVMEGTSGCVRIISTGIPVKWLYEYKEYENNEKAVENLINNFEKLILYDTINGVEIRGRDFKKEEIARRVTTLTLEDLNRVYNLVYGGNRSLEDVSTIEKDENKLFNLKGSKTEYYWLATVKEGSSTDIYYVLNGTILQDSMLRVGIRPVIELKEGLNGKLESNVWKIID